MRLQEFTTAEEQMDLLKFISDNIYNVIELQDFKQEQKHAFDQQKQKKMPKTSQPRKNSTTPPKLAKPSKPKVVASPPSKSIKTSPQQISRDKERKNTAKSVPQTTSLPKSSFASTQAQNTLQARSQLPLHDPNSVANTARKLYPLANDDVVKRLTN
jgi:hypothetical protein